MNGSGFDLPGSAAGNEKIVNSPSRILFPGMDHIVPSTVRTGQVWIKATEGTGEA